MSKINLVNPNIYSILVGRKKTVYGEDAYITLDFIHKPLLTLA